jgi:protein SCO1/2
MVRRKFLLTIIVINVIAIPLIFYFSANRFQRQAQAGTAALAVYGQAPSFNLIDESGQSLSSRALGETAWLASFMYSECPSQCPMMNAKIEHLQKILPAYARVISFSVDPENDTPEVLAAYSKKFNAQPGKWTFLTGKKTEIDRVLEGFHLNREGDPALHSLRLVLVDREGFIRSYYDTTDPKDLRKLERDLINLSAGGSHGD